MSHELHEALDNGHDMRIVFMDMSKAFDKVGHKGVIFKLKRKGIDGLLLKWFISYLKNRFQRVVIGGQSSNELPVQTGVPQESILGPLFFLIYMNDIIDKILCDIRLFADDTWLLEIVHNAIESARRLNSDLRTLHNVVHSVVNAFNFIKTVIFTISRRKKSLHNPELVMDCSNLQEVDQHRHLGVVFNKSLTWDSHIEYIF